MDGQGNEIGASAPEIADTKATVQARHGYGVLALQSLATIGIYFLLAKFGLQLASVNPSTTAIWPPTGFAVAVVLLWGYRVLPALFIAAAAANAATAVSISTAFAIAFGNTLEAFAIGYVVNRWSNGWRTFETPANVTRFAIACLASGTVISASIGVGALVLSGSASSTDTATLWLTWWLGDSTGALVLAPLIVLWARGGKRLIQPKNRVDGIVVFASAAIVGVIAFSPLFSPTFLRAPLGFLAILPLLAAALRLNQRDTVTVAFILSVFAVWGAALSSGPFVQPRINDSFLLVLAFVISISIPSLALSAEVAQRRRQEKELRAIFYQAQMGIAQCDMSGRFLAVNDKYAEIAGRPVDELLTLRRDEITDPEDRARDVALFNEACATGTGFTNEKRLVKPDGTQVWVWNNVTPMLDDDGAVLRVVSMCADVSDRRNSQERQTLLMAELNHRVRNTLATIQAMARLTSQGAVTKDEYVKSLQGRISTMARTHELLTRERWEGVPLDELVHDELTAYAGQRDTVAIDGPKLLLRPRQALDLALVVHELATNAAKYGALSRRGGRVAINWTITRKDGLRCLHFTWQEFGGPAVTPPSRKGFGSHLIRNTFSGADKSVDLEFMPEGVRCTIDIAIEHRN